MNFSKWLQTLLSRLFVAFFMSVGSLCLIIALWSLYRGPPSEFSNVTVSSPVMTGQRTIVTAHESRVIPGECVGSGLFSITYPDKSVLYGPVARLRYTDGRVIFNIRIPSFAPLGPAVFSAKESFTCGRTRWSETPPLNIVIEQGPPPRILPSTPHDQGPE